MGKLILQRGRATYPLVWEHRGTHASLLIGRGYHCDCIVPDRFVDVEQVRLRSVLNDDTAPQEALCQLLVLGQTNPVLVNGRVLKARACWLRTGDRFTVGRTTYAVFSPNHPVHKTDSFALSHWLMHLSIRPWVALSALLLLCAVIIVDKSLTTYETFAWHDYALGVVFVPSLVVIWSAIWAFIGRLLRGQPLFLAHVVFASIGAIGSIVLWGVYDYVAFMTNLEVLAMAVDFLLFAVVFGLTLGFHLSFASSVQHAFSTGVVFACVIATVLGLVSLTERGDWSQVVDHNKSLKAPPIPHPTPVPLENYVSGYDRLIESIPED